jgi:hypothetical protein
MLVLKLATPALGVGYIELIVIMSVPMGGIRLGSSEPIGGIRLRSEEEAIVSLRKIAKR